jgi:hypothetical protein
VTVPVNATGGGIIPNVTVVISAVTSRVRRPDRFPEFVNISLRRGIRFLFDRCRRLGKFDILLGRLELFGLTNFNHSPRV